MPVRVTVPNGLKPYIALGLNPEYSDSSTQAFADCPWCGGENKFTIQIQSSLSRCFKCDARPNQDVYPGSEGFNAISFAHTVWDTSQTKEERYTQLSLSRKLLFPQTLIDWGVRWNLLHPMWLIPAFDQNGKFHQLYRYMMVNDQMKLIPLPGLHGEGESHGLFGMQNWDNSKQTVWLCEGPWDAMALAEILQRVQQRGDMLYLTDYANESLLNGINVIAVPGANVFKEYWSETLNGKDVVIPFDSDHPVRNRLTNQLNIPVGWEGCKKIVEHLLSLDENKKPNQVQVVQWGEKGFDPGKPSGYDIRDHLSSGGDTVEDRVQPLATLLGKVCDPPDTWKANAKKIAKKELACKPCSSWADLKETWRVSGMKWNDGLDYSLSAMLATAMSTNHIGEQIWIMVLSPPSTGKTTLALAMAVSKKYVLYVDTLTKLFSGYQVDAEGKHDVSLMPKAKDKTFIIKDGDTLRTLPNRNFVMSQLRTIYDRSIHVSFGNKMSRDHDNFSTTMIICGTGAMRELDKSELGGRYLTVSVMDMIDPRHERDAARRAAEQVRSNLGMMLNGKPESTDTPEMIEAKQMTGGYVEYLRKNSSNLIAKVKFLDDALETVLDAAEFTALLRARPSVIQNEITEREMTPRLSKQLTLFAACMAAVMNRPSVDNVILDRIRKIAKDTSSGITRDIAKVLYEKGKTGHEPLAVAIKLSKSANEVSQMMHFMTRIGVLERFEIQDPRGGKGHPRYVLTSRMHTLYRSIMETYVSPREVKT